MNLFFTLMLCASDALSPEDISDPSAITKANPLHEPQEPQVNKSFLSHNKVYRQELIVTRPAPKGFTVNFVATLTSKLSTQDNQRLSIVLHYMPDRWIIQSQDFYTYLCTILPLADEIETFLLMIMDDLNNQLVPRWLMLNIIADHDDQSYKLTAEDQQPGWSRPAVVNRILLY